MTDPTSRNRLDEEASPYLQQHADNPVHWQPWDEMAREAARERDVPIFLSVGYSACHWCHVMAEESFADEDVAAYLNEHFVPVKVDREERPDVDSVYMTICQQVTGRGGWPLSVWLTPEGKPFYVGTYFPPEATRGTPGFRDVLENVVRSWEEEREKVEQRADQWAAAIAGELEATPDAPGDAPDETVLESAAQAAVRGADREFGGWGSGGPKFPLPGRLHLLMRAADRTDRDVYGEIVTETLDAMADGGMYDHVGGGFHRYATDRRWVVPHFEKMLYDNAELARAYLAGFQFVGRDRYADVAAETLAFVERELSHPDGGFYSTLDARSEGEEGKFYVWTPDDVRAAVDDETTAALFRDRYGVTDAGNFEGKTVLTLSAAVDDLAADYDLDETEVRERLDDARTAVFAARSDRVRPARDEKVLAGWNGLMISAFAAGERVLGGSHRDKATDRASGHGATDAYADVATDALTFVREHLWDADERRLARRYKDGDVKGDGYLEDYAFLGRGAFDCYQATGDVEHLAFALELARTIESEFYDADVGTLYYTSDRGESLVARPQELNDQSTPSSTGVAVALLLDLDHFAPHDRFGDVAETVLETHRPNLDANPLQHASLVLAADDYARGALELTVAADDLPDDWRATLAETYLPGTILSVRPPTEAGLDAWLDALGLDAAPPIWDGREARDGHPTVYACEAFTCSPPQHDLDAALAWADENA
ncbi:MAG: thioredoxin domain-containing protein [Haloarculaceae archaeon]